MSTHAAGPPAFNRHLLRAAMIASAGAAAIHLGAAHSHLVEYTPAGAFMFLSGFAQFAWVLWMLQPTGRACAAGIAANAGIIGLWGVSRTMGLPFGATPWMPEDVHTTDALATSLELIVVVACAGLLRHWTRPASRRLAALAATGTLLGVLATAHEPSRERAVAAAALLVIAATAGLSIAVSRMPAIRRRNHVEGAYARSRRSVFDGGAWPTIGARG